MGRETLNLDARVLVSLPMFRGRDQGWGSASAGRWCASGISGPYHRNTNRPITAPSSAVASTPAVYQMAMNGMPLSVQ